MVQEDRDHDLRRRSREKDCDSRPRQGPKKRLSFARSKGMSIPKDHVDLEIVPQLTYGEHVAREAGNAPHIRNEDAASPAVFIEIDNRQVPDHRACLLPAACSVHSIVARTSVDEG